MQTRLPPLNSLRAFETSARHRSFTRAAEELNVTPAAISHQIKGLEEVLGAPLFRRAKGTLMLTDEGQRLLPGVRKGFAAFAEAMENFALYHQTGPLNVALTPSFAAKWLIPRMEQLERPPPGDRHPHHDHHGPDRLRAGWRGYRGSLRPRRLWRPRGRSVARLGGHAGLQPAAAVQRQAAWRSQSDLARFTLLHDESPLFEATHPNWAMWLKAAEVTDVDARHGLRFDNASACINAAIEGAGVALARTALIGSDVAAGRLVRLFELSLPSAFGYYVVYPKRSEKLPKVMAFRDWLFEEVREQPSP